MFVCWLGILYLWVCLVAAMWIVGWVCYTRLIYRLWSGIWLLFLGLCWVGSVWILCTVSFSLVFDGLVGGRLLIAGWDGVARTGVDCLPTLVGVSGVDAGGFWVVLNF